MLIRFTFNTVPVINLGNDTTVCPGSPVVLDAGNAGAVFQWSNGSSLQTIQSIQPGIFSVSVTEQGCTSSGSIEIIHLPAPIVDLGNDTSVCTGETILLDAANAGSQFTWSIGSQAQTIQTGAAGIHWVEVDNGVCSVRDSLWLSLHPLPLVNLGNDTSLCDSQLLSLNAANPGSNYTWSDGSTSNTLNVQTSGAYHVSVENSGGCTTADTIGVLFNPLPLIGITPDTFLCQGNTLGLTATGGSVYAWSPSTGLNSTSVANPQVSLSQPVSYTVVVITQFGCVDSQSVFVDVLFPPVLDLGNDTSLCAGQSVAFTAPPGFDTYVWSDGSTDGQITAASEGLYWLGVSNTCGTIYDSVVIENIYPLPNIDLGNDTVICETAALHLSVAEFPGTYLWSTGETGAVIFPPVSDHYYVEVTDQHACSGHDSISVLINSAPQANLGEDTTLCYGDKLTFTISEWDATWMGNNTGPEMEVDQPGTYWLQLEDPSQVCPPSSDTIRVEYFDCNCVVWLPNAFSPNGDGNNDVFKPEVDCDISNFTLKIFNRWGEQVFMTDDPYTYGWDGLYKGVRMEAGVFVYSVEYSGRYNFEKQHNRETGSVTLMR